VLVTGIPIANSFGNEAANRKQKSLREVKRVLIMGGGLGIGLLPLVERIVDWDMNHEVTVVCGHNQPLRRKLYERYGNRPHVRILGYTRQVSRLMADHDLLVTKPGGLTISEALAMRLPMVLYTPISGQEMRNGQMMADLGVAVVAHTVEQAANCVRHLAERDLVLQKIADCMEAIRRPFAAREVAKAVLERAEQHSLNLADLRMIR